MRAPSPTGPVNMVTAPISTGPAYPGGVVALLAPMALVVALGGSFGEASASAVPTGSTSMLVEIMVEVSTDVDVVVAHFSLPGDADVTVPLLDRGDGVFGLRTELRRGDYQVVFEIVGEDTTPPMSLTSLGVASELADTGAVSPVTTQPDEISDDTRQRGWLALALAAGALATLAFWALGDRTEQETRRSVSGPGGEEE